MEISPNELDFEKRYKLLTGAVVPRPIALVSTVSSNGVNNLAPFSYFSIASHDPMTLSICITGAKPDHSSKDTLKNIQMTREFVVSVATERFAAEMVKTSAPIAYGESEFDFAGLTPLPSKRIRPARVAESPISFECEVLEVVPVGNSNVVLGTVLQVFVEDGLLDDRFRIDFDKLAAVGRLAGTGYVRTADRLHFEKQVFFPKRRLEVQNG